MEEKIICLIASFGCAILFYAIGIYAKRCKKPMSFWTWSTVQEYEITDVKGYNRANSIMWKLYSLWYFFAGVAEIWSSALFAIILTLGCTLGIFILVITYKKIYKKYKV